MSGFHFDLSLKLSQGEVHDFSGEAQRRCKIHRGGAKRSQGRCAPPYTSSQNPTMVYNKKQLHVEGGQNREYSPI
jgi:hypothetical protein